MRTQIPWYNVVPNIYVEGNTVFIAWWSLFIPSSCDWLGLHNLQKAPPTREEVMNLVNHLFVSNTRAYIPDQGLYHILSVQNNSNLIFTIGPWKYVLRSLQERLNVLILLLNNALHKIWVVYSPNDATFPKQSSFSREHWTAMNKLSL